VQLLETRRPYLTDVIRCPGLQTALLLARRIDLPRDMDKILVDQWLLFEFHDQAAAVSVRRWRVPRCSTSRRSTML
jgi:hypothetical protein